MKKVIAMLLTLTLLASVTGCASNKVKETGETTEKTVATEEATTEAATEEATTEAAGPYAGYDLSEPVNIIMYAMGDPATDMDKVIAKANEEYIKPILNSTLEVKFLSWSDYQTKYSLVLAGGEPVDLMYTASWCYYNQEAAKGAFRELNMDWIKQWMPQTYVSQAPSSWDQIAISGKIYAVPQNYSAYASYKFLGYRDDLAQKYSLPAITDFGTLEQYLYKIAENEPGVQAYAASKNSDELLRVFTAEKGITNIGCGDTTAIDFQYAWNNKADAPKPEDITYFYTSDVYKEYCLKMAEYAEKGVWNQSAINNSVSAKDAYIQGTGATLFWNQTVFSAGDTMEDNGVGTYAVADLSSNAAVRYANYATDAIAITSTSENPERAALVLDLLKNDKDLFTLIYAGIEGEHYVVNADGTFSDGPNVENYLADNWSWGFRAFMPEYSGADERKVEFNANLTSRLLTTDIDGFTFDSTPVQTEVSVISSLWEEYRGAFGLGVYGKDTEKYFNEFKEKMENAGLDKVKEEFLKQYSNYCTAKGITF